MDVQNTVALRSFCATSRAMVCIDSLVWRLWALRAPKAQIFGLQIGHIFENRSLVGLDFHSVSAHGAISDPNRASETGFCDVRPPDLLDI